MAGFKFELGQELVCQVTGFCGIALSRSETITGQRSYSLQSRKLGKRGEYPESQWIDEGMLTITGDKIKLK